MKWLSWLRRRIRPSLSPPVRPDESGVRRAQEQIRQAESTLADLEAHESEVDHVSRAAEELHRRNNLGPAFMAALGKHRRAQ